MNKVETAKKMTFTSRLARDLRKNKAVYIMLIPAIVYYLIFCYGPMYGAIIAF